MATLHPPTTRTGARGISGIAAAFSGARRGERTTDAEHPEGSEPRRRKRARAAGVPPRRPVEAELIGLRGAEPDWWTTCWERGVAETESPNALFEAIVGELPGVVASHDLRIAGTDTTIDHVVVGPGGIVVIDTVRCPGRVRSDGVHLRVGGKDRSTLVDMALWRTETVRSVLAARGLRDLPVHGVLHWQDAAGLGARAICLRGILLLTAGAAAGLAANGIAVSPLAAERAREALEARPS